MHQRPHLEYLLLEAMLQVVPDVVHGCRHLWQQQGHTGEPDRTTLLGCLLRSVGPARFLKCCEELPSHAPTSPLFFLLYNSSSPGSLVNKISLHAPHFHPTRRLELLEESDDHFIVEDVYYDGNSPAPADDLFVCSALKGVLQEYGCRDIEIEWEAVRSRELNTILNSIGIKPLAIEKFTRWRFRWDRLERSCRIEGMDSFVLEKIDANDEMDSFIFHLQLFLSEDLSRRPPLEEAASRLKTSPRSLQRKLMAKGTSYTKIYNELRLKAAEKLLLTTSLTLAEISLFSGFNDSAHLCREFSKKHHITPNKFRHWPYRHAS